MLRYDLLHFASVYCNRRNYSIVVILTLPSLALLSAPEKPSSVRYMSAELNQAVDLEILEPINTPPLARTALPTPTPPGAIGTGTTPRGGTSMWRRVGGVFVSKNH